MSLDYLIVGAGFSGCVLAERLASQLNKKVLVIDRRNHIGGNCFDYFNDDGLLVHKYGPHYFRTNDEDVWDYLSLFTKWHNSQYKVFSFVDGQYFNFPINLGTFNKFFGLSLSSAEMADRLEKLRLECSDIKNSRDVIVSKIGVELYEKFYKNYTKKQWGVWPEQLDSSVCARIPIRTNYDERYSDETFQAMPQDGYHRIFERMLDHPNIQVSLNTDYCDIKDDCEYCQLIYTGPVDEFFDYRFGKLPYRSLRFKHQTFNREFYLPVPQVNYPNDHDYTRIVEIKHVTGQNHPKTTIVREYPAAEGEPYYPVPRAQNEELYQKYLSEEHALVDTFLIGRLARYRYLNMDQVVSHALQLFEEHLRFI